MKFKLLGLATAIGLAGCGSSDESVATFSITANVSGLARPSVTISVENDSQTQSVTATENGSLPLQGEFEDGTSVNLQVNENPAGQTCDVSPSTVTYTGSAEEIVAIQCSNIEYTVSVNADDSVPEGIELTYSGVAQGSITLDAGESFTLPGTFIYEDRLEFSVSDRPGFSCEVDTQEIQITANIDSINVACTSNGSVSGNVNDLRNGRVISGSTVEAFQVDEGEEFVFGNTEVGDDGFFTIPGVDTLRDFGLRIFSDEHVANTHIFQPIGEEAERQIDLDVLTYNERVMFAANEPIFVYDQSQNETPLVAVGPSAFAYADGELVTSDIAVSYGVINPGMIPAAMPGDYQAISSLSGERAYIESFGALSVVFQDAEGEPVNLRAGESATVSIPLANNSVGAPSEIPLYWFNEQTGIWQEEGTALLTSHNGELYYVGEVEHFTTWNAARPYETVTINSCVVDINGDPVANAAVFSEGSSYIGRTQVLTDVEGRFELPVQSESNVLYYAIAEGHSNTASVFTLNEDITNEDCLVLGTTSASVKLSWGANPRDLDSHFTGPMEDSTSRFHVYYGNTMYEDEARHIFLDVDDTTSFGPEVVSISNFVVPGVYRYGVDHFSGSGSIGDSPTRVELRLNSQTYVFTPAAIANTTELENRMWVVFDLIVDDDLQITVREINSYDFRSALNDLSDTDDSPQPSSMLELPPKSN